MAISYFGVSILMIFAMYPAVLGPDPFAQLRIEEENAHDKGWRINQR
jgi:hypothetical protein